MQSSPERTLPGSPTAQLWLCWPPALRLSQQHLWASVEVKAGAMCYSDKHGPMPRTELCRCLSRAARMRWGRAAPSHLNEELFGHCATLRRARLSLASVVATTYNTYDMEWCLEIQIANPFPHQLCFFSTGRARRM